MKKSLITQTRGVETHKIDDVERAKYAESLARLNSLTRLLKSHINLLVNSSAISALTIKTQLCLICPADALNLTYRIPLT